MEKRRVSIGDNDYLEVTKDGKIFHHGKLMKTTISKTTGYESLIVSNHNYLVHRLVASAYICPLKRGDRSVQVHHINKNKSDNRTENLCVLPAAEHIHMHKQKYPLTKQCVICGKEFIPDKTKRKRQQVCSSECWHEIVKINARMNKKPISQYTTSGVLIKQWDSARDVQNELGYFESNINKCCNGVIHTYKGYVWKYAEREVGV